MSSLKQLLEEREKTHGSFMDHAQITQVLKHEMKHTKNWQRLSAPQKESLEMIVHKIGRVLSGDPNHIDSWVDIAGYATLISSLLQGL